ncbi:MAG: CoA transferase, partial [Pseudomonadales bacterium]|nr:CoA transferase [Pseudomonadales bacterium]
AGALHPIGRKGEKPTIPLNLVGDFGGGGMLMAFGISTALFETTRSGKGQVVDAAMIDGAALLLSSVLSAAQLGDYWKERGNNMLDGGAHFYEVYETADGRYVAVGAVEGHFYRTLLECLGLDNEALPDQNDQSSWESMKARFTAIFKTRTRDEWCTVFEGRDACFSPVLEMKELVDHPHHKARGDFVEVGGVWQPSPAPRFSRTPSSKPTVSITAGKNSREILDRFGFDSKKQDALLNSGIVI